jgi:hypothetical protein
MARKLRTFGLAAAALIVLSAGLGVALAESGEKPTMEQQRQQEELRRVFLGESGEKLTMEQTYMGTLVKSLLEVIIFGALGLVILVVGYRVLDMATPFDLNKEIAEDDNVAAGALAAGMLIAMAIVIHAAMAL